jgi:hypothetical protein
MPLLPLALDIYVRSIQLKGSKPRLSTSINSNEAAVPSEAKLAEAARLPKDVSIALVLGSWLRFTAD